MIASFRFVKIHQFFIFIQKANSSEEFYNDEVVGGYCMGIMGVIIASAALRTNLPLQEIGTNTKAV